MTVTPEIFDRKLLRRRQARAGEISGPASFLFTRSAEDIGERISAVNRDFSKGVVQGPVGDHLKILIETLSGKPIQTVIHLNTWLGSHIIPLSVVADEEVLPCGPSTLDLFVNILSLHTVNDLPGALSQIRRSLKPDGLFVAVLLGGATLHELRTSFSEAEAEVEGGISPRVSPFADVRDLGSLLQRAGFALPVTDVDTVDVTYASPFDLFQDLRAFGWTNALKERRKTFLRRTTLMRMAEIYNEKFSAPDGRVRATFELIYLTGWAPHESQQTPLRPGSANTRLADALKVEEVKIEDRNG